jgi:hypothetical protein
MMVIVYINAQYQYRTFVVQAIFGIQLLGIFIISSYLKFTFAAQNNHP